MLAEVNSLPYNIVLLLHILAVIVAFAPGFVWPLVMAGLRKEGESMPPSVMRRVPVNSSYVHGPALVIAGLLGIVLVLLSDEVWEFSQRWISAAFVLWFVMLGVLFLGLLPAERKASDPSSGKEVESRIGMFGGMLHLLLALELVVMIWGPR